MGENLGKRKGLEPSKADDFLPEGKQDKKSTHPLLNKRLQSLKLNVTNVVNQVTCRSTVVRVMGSPHRGTCCA